MYMRNKIMGVALILLCIGGQIYGQRFAPGSGDGAVPVEVQELQVRELYKSVFYGCRLKPVQRLPHRSPITGSLESILVRTGQRVSRGTPLFTVRRELAGRSYNSVEVTASAGGVISDIEILIGAPVQENETIITVLDDSAFIGEILVSDKDIGAVRPGDSCRVFENKTATDSTGKVVTVSPEPVYETGLFPVELRFPKTAGLFIGKFIRVELRQAPFKGISVPAETIVRKYGEDHLFIVDDGKAELRQVTLGRNYNELVTILTGAEAGELYVSSSTRNLSDGAEVQISGEE